MKDIRQTKNYAKHLKNIGWIVINKKDNYYFIKKFPIIGSVLKLQRPEQIILKDIKKLAKDHRCFQIIIEPKDNMQAKLLKDTAFTLSKSTFLPSKTLQLDLTKSRKTLFANLKKDAKRSIEKENNSKLKKTKNLKIFHKAWKSSVNIKRYVASYDNLKSLKKEFSSSSLFLTSHNINKEITAGAIFLLAEKSAYYWQAFTNKEGRSSLAQYKIVWEGILWAKGKGAKIFDFEGIYDSRFPNKNWKGFTLFKKKFGGEVKQYPGCYTKWRLPI